MSETTTRTDQPGPESPEAFAERKSRLLHMVTPQEVDGKYASTITLHVDIIETDDKMPRFGLHTEDYLACGELEDEGLISCVETLSNQAIYRLRDALDRESGRN